MDDQKPSQKPDDKNPERERKVREKLRELYGDDTPETVRRFLTDLIEQDSGDDWIH